VKGEQPSRNAEVFEETFKLVLVGDASDRHTHSQGCDCQVHAPCQHGVHTTRDRLENSRVLLPFHNADAIVVVVLELVIHLHSELEIA